MVVRVVPGRAAETLCAASMDAQLLVVGSHGHGPLAEAVLGSVARYCVQHASCPVVVIPAERAEPVAVTASAVARPEALGYGPGPVL